jgi:hypothetical protein
MNIFFLYRRMRFSSVTIRPNGSDNLTLVSQEAGTM